ncbi:PaaI family thioesterase [Streptomyces sp. NBC_00046]|uniref:PaaI family thioesterase n=1 Tax=unclassified Streptomyces TaxID=2593676 RepID=UPI003246412C
MPVFWGRAVLPSKAHRGSTTCLEGIGGGQGQRSWGAQSPMVGSRYPTPISDLPGLHIVDTGEETTLVRAEVDAALHGSQQGTVHGGFLVEVADTAIGTAHSTLMGTGESFTAQIAEIPLRHRMRNRKMRTQSTHDFPRMKSG